MRYKLLLPTVALLAAIAPEVHATVLLPGDLSEIARGAAAIVRGTVVDVRAEWADGRRRVATIVTLDVAETFKGAMAGRVSFQVPGGLMGRYRSVTVGAPSFSPGEEVIVCLGARAPALPYVLGLSQGVFRVRRDPQSGQRLVSTPVLLASSQGDTVVTRGDPARRPMSVDRFSATLRAVLSADKSQQVPRPRSGKIEK